MTPIAATSVARALNAAGSSRASVGSEHWPLPPARSTVRRCGRVADDGVLAGAVVELVVQVDGGVDQRQVGERLGEVAQLLPGLADLLGVQAQVVGVGEHLLEDQPGLLQASRTGQRIHIPEGTDREGAL